MTSAILSTSASAGRVLVAGGPRTGKTTLSDRLEAKGIPVYHTDALIGSHEWSEASAEVARWLEEPGPWVVEGVSSVRAARKFMAKHPDKKPCDLFVWVRGAKVDRTPGQAAMARGVATIFAGIRPELERRGVKILEVP